MNSINSNYSAVLPVQGDVVTDLSGITASANAQITSERTDVNNTSSSIDWVLFEKNTSHQTISINESTSTEITESLDTLVISILSHIAHQPDTYSVDGL